MPNSKAQKQNVANRYQLLKVIDVESQRWLALDRFQDQQVELQLCSPKSLPQNAWAFYFLQFSQHRNLMQLMDFGWNDFSAKNHKMFYFVYPSVETATLTSKIAKLSPPQINDLCRQSLSALFFLHTHHVCHGDLKIENFKIAQGINGDWNFLLVNYSSEVFLEEPSEKKFEQERNKWLALWKSLIKKQPHKIDRLSGFLQNLVKVTNFEELKKMAGGSNLERSLGIENKLIATLLERDVMIQNLKQYFRDTTQATAQIGICTIDGESGSGKTSVLRFCAVQLKIHGVQVIALQTNRIYQQLESLLKVIGGRPLKTPHLLAGKESEPHQLALQLQQFIALLGKSLSRRTQPLVLLIDNVGQLVDAEQSSLLTLMQVLNSWKGDLCLGFLLSCDTFFIHDWKKRSAAASIDQLFINLPPLSSAASEKLLTESLAGVRCADSLKQAMVRLAHGNPMLLEKLISYSLQNGRLSSGHLEVETQRLGALFDPHAKTPWLGWLHQRAKDLTEAQLSCALYLAALHEPMPRELIEMLLPESTMATQIVSQLIDAGLVQLENQRLGLRYRELKQYFLSLPIWRQQANSIRYHLVEKIDLLSSQHKNFKNDLLLQQESYLQQAALGLSTQKILQFCLDLEKNAALQQTIWFFRTLAGYLVQTAGEGEAWEELSLFLIDKMVSAAQFELADQLLGKTISSYCLKHQISWSGFNSELSLSMNQPDNVVLFVLTLLKQAGRLCRFHGDFAQANRVSQLGLQLAKQRQQTPLYLAFASQFAVVQLLQGEYEACIRFINEFLEHPYPMQESIIQLMICRGHCWRGLRDFARAHAEYLHALEKSQLISYQLGLANLLQSLGLLEQQLGHLDAAADYMMQAIEAFEKLTNQVGVVSAQFTFAQVEFDQVKISSAWDHLQQCHFFYRSLNNQRDLADVTLYIGRLQNWVGFRREGVANLRFALWLAEDKKFRHLAGMCHWQLAMTELHDGHWRDAKLHLDSAHAIYAGGHYATHVHKCQLLIQYFDRWLNDPNNYDGKFSVWIEKSLLQLEWRDRVELSVVILQHGVLQFELEKLFPDLEQLSLRQSFELLAAYLRGCQLRGDLPNPGNLEKFEKMVDKLQTYLPEEMRLTFYNNWFCHESSQLKRKTPLIEPSQAEHEDLTVPNQQDQLSQMTTALTTLNQIGDRKRLLQVAAGLLQTIFPSQRLALVARENPSERSLLELIAQSTNLLRIPEGLTVIGMTRSQRSFAVQEDQQVLTLIQLFCRGSLSVHDPLVHHDYLLLPLHVANQSFGFVYFNQIASKNFEQFLPLLKLFINQLAVLLFNLYEARHFAIAQDSESNIRDGILMPTDNDEPLFANSPLMRDTVDLLQRLRGSETTVLIEGVAGTGKELIAKYILSQSKRFDKPWLKVDCAAIPETLFEAQFFGYIKGAFTGAHADHKGYFQVVEGGTLLLDNVAELSLASQAKLLRVLQEGELQRVGSVVTEKVDVRMIVTTQEELTKLCEAGRFRLDLYYRLEVIKISLPRLKERREDLPELANHFLGYYQKQSDLKDRRITLSDEVMQTFRDYPWPGNVHELRNEMERLILHLGERKEREIMIQPNELAPKFLELRNLLPTVVNNLTVQTKKRGLGGTLKEIERTIVQDALTRHRGNITNTAKEFGIARSSLRKRIKRLGIRE